MSKFDRTSDRLYFGFIQGIFIQHSRATVKKNNEEKKQKILSKWTVIFELFLSKENKLKFSHFIEALKHYIIEALITETAIKFSNHKV